MHNESNWLFEEFIRVVKIWQPDFVVFENVQGITNTCRGFFLEAILDRFARLKYTLNYGVLNALDSAYNVIMSSLGPKLTAITLYKLHRENEARGLVYAPSNEFSLEYSSGIGPCFEGTL